jgi:hypothetical protein
MIVTDRRLTDAVLAVCAWALVVVVYRSWSALVLVATVGPFHVGPVGERRRSVVFGLLACPAQLVTGWLGDRRAPRAVGAGRHSRPLTPTRDGLLDRCSASRDGRPVNTRELHRDGVKNTCGVHRLIFRE